MGEAKSEAATSAHKPTSGPCLTRTAVKTMARIPSTYATGTIHGIVAMGLATSLSVNSRAAAEEREALSQKGFTVSSESSLNQSRVAPGPTTIAPTSIVATAETRATAKAFHRRLTSGQRIMGASDGFSATTRPKALPETTKLPRRSEIHAATNPVARTGYIWPRASVFSRGEERSSSTVPGTANLGSNRTSLAIQVRYPTVAIKLTSVKMR